MYLLLMNTIQCIPLLVIMQATGSQHKLTAGIATYLFKGISLLISCRATKRKGEDSLSFHHSHHNRTSVPLEKEDTK